MILALGSVACAEPAGLLGPVEAVSAAVPPGAEAFAARLDQHRRSVGCAPLIWHAQASAVAERHSRDMHARGYFSHTSPEGLTPFDRLTRAGIHYSTAGENIARGYADADAAFAGWLKSPGHRASIENCAFTHQGLGRQGDHWTHVFLTPR